MRVGLWDLFFFVLLGVVVALAIRLAGTLLVFAFLVLPAVTGLLLSRNLSKIHAVAVGTAGISTIAGLYCSFRLDLPSGPAIVACAFIVLLLAWAASRFRH